MEKYIELLSFFSVVLKEASKNQSGRFTMFLRDIKVNKTAVAEAKIEDRRLAKIVNMVRWHNKLDKRLSKIEAAINRKSKPL